MRKTLLEAIYLGYYLPAEKVSGGAEYEEYHEATAEASEVYERFKEKLDSEQVKTLDRFWKRMRLPQQQPPRTTLSRRPSLGLR